MKTNAKLTGKRCQCSVCKEYFSTVNNFDRHRVGTHADGKTCADPETVGLVIGQSGPSTFWVMPGKPENDVGQTLKTVADNTGVL